MLHISKVCIIFAVLSSVYSLPSPRRREISIHLFRSVRSAMLATENLGVTYVSMLKAYEILNTEQGTDLYWVTFLAESHEGGVRDKQECSSQVLWPAFGPRKVLTANCAPVNSSF